MDAGEEHLFNVGLRPVQIIDLNFVPLAPRLSVKVEGRDIFDAAFVETQRMAEVQNGVVRVAER